VIYELFGAMQGVADREMLSTVIAVKASFNKTGRKNFPLIDLSTCWLRSMAEMQ
jgi:hypothetical protein